jgi:hypothetical protein
VGDGKFYPLTKFDIRLDKVEVARDKSVHAFVTLKNPSGAEQLLINDSIKVFLEDADGLAFRVSRIRARLDARTGRFRQPAQTGALARNLKPASCWTC